MNIEQTLEALDHVITSETMLASSTITHSTTSLLCAKRAEKLQALRDSLPALIADSETLRKMKEAGPTLYAPPHYVFLSSLAIECSPMRLGPDQIPLYALPDEVTK